MLRGGANRVMRVHLRRFGTRPTGSAETGPSIAELVSAVKAAGGFVGGDALFDPRYEPEMRRFLIRALEMEGIPVPKGGGTP